MTLREIRISLIKFIDRFRTVPSDVSYYYGKFYVVYPDGQRSSKMDYRTAKEYQQIFGGKVYHISEVVK